MEYVHAHAQHTRAHTLKHAQHTASAAARRPQPTGLRESGPHSAAVHGHHHWHWRHQDQGTKICESHLCRVCVYVGVCAVVHLSVVMFVLNCYPLSTLTPSPISHPHSLTNLPPSLPHQSPTLTDLPNLPTPSLISPLSPLSQKTKTSIKIFSDPMPNSNERSVQLIGTEEQITECIEHFLEEISKVCPVGHSGVW